jgi:hypothetical protein
MLGMLMHVNNRTHPSIFRLSIARLSFRSLARADEVRTRRVVGGSLQDRESMNH